MTSTNSALTIPVFDPVGAVRALVHGWVLPALGKGLALAASPFVRPLVREIEALLHARSDAEVEALVRRNERKNRRRMIPLMTAAGVLAGVGGRGRAERILTEARGMLPKFWTWWESEREKSAASPEVLSQMDVAVYSACRSLGRLFPLLASGAGVPRLRVADIAHAMTASQVFVAALIACLLVDREGPKPPGRVATEALVQRTVADVDALSRFVAGVTQ